MKSHPAVHPNRMIYRTWRHLVFALLSLFCSDPGSAAQTNRPFGTIVWGDLPYVEPGTRFTAIGAGLRHSVALTADGTAVTWGAGTGAPLAAQSGVVAVAAGGIHVLALKSDGS